LWQLSNISPAIFLGRHESPNILWDGLAVDCGPRQWSSAVDTGLGCACDGHLYLVPGRPAPASTSHTSSGHPALPRPPLGPHPTACLGSPGHRHSLLCFGHPPSVGVHTRGPGRDPLEMVWPKANGQKGYSAMTCKMAEPSVKILFPPSRALVTHACNLSDSGGRKQEDHSSKPGWANSLQDPILKKATTRERAVEWLKW
jgi:hypothetical protein